MKLRKPKPMRRRALRAAKAVVAQATREARLARARTVGRAMA